jgi:hypothetical protein
MYCAVKLKSCPITHGIFCRVYEAKEIEFQDSLNLINRLKAENERYKGVIKILEKDVADAKTEAYKEFAERLKQRYSAPIYNVIMETIM